MSRFLYVADDGRFLKPAEVNEALCGRSWPVTIQVNAPIVVPVSWDVPSDPAFPVSPPTIYRRYEIAGGELPESQGDLQALALSALEAPAP